MSLKNGLKLFGGYFFRWTGFSTEPRLIEVGKPDENSPVLLTCNFIITVKRILKAIKGLDCYLLIAPSNGINVWCGACGDDFDTNSVISILKTSEINEKVKHRTLILPQLSAPGIDPVEIKKKTGWDVKFGPVYAKDIKIYIKNGFKKTEQQRIVRFPLLKRLEMANLYFFSFFLIFTIFYFIVGIFLPILDLKLFLVSLLVFIIVIYGSLTILPSIPTKTGKPKVLVYEILLICVLIYLYFLSLFNFFYLIWMIILSLLAALMMMEDFNGLTSIYKSELGEKTWKKGQDKMNFLFGEYKLQPYGQITLDREKCIGCKMCIEVCPRNLYSFNEIDKKVNLKNSEECINCNACVKRCLGHCLEIV
ncbi:MAG: HgcAB-like fusion protein [Promethearchaeota archaeon]